MNNYKFYKELDLENLQMKKQQILMYYYLIFQYTVEYDWNEGMFPLTDAPKGKKAFLSSKNERIMINKLVIIREYLLNLN